MFGVSELLRPRDLGGSCVAMLFLHPDPSVRRLAAPGFIDKNNIGQACSDRIEDQFACLTAPQFDNVRLHRFVFVVSQADRNFNPGEGDLVRLIISLGAEHLGAGIVGRDGQLRSTGIHNRQVQDIPLDIQKTCLDPARDLVLDQYPIPVLRVHAADEFDVGCGAERKEIEIFGSGSIAAAQQIGRHCGFQAFYRWKGCIGG